MATPDPALVAASPVLKQALGYLKQCVTTILTGDPAQISLRAAPAVTIMNNQLMLLLPQLATAEEGVALQQATAGIDSLIAKLP